MRRPEKGSDADLVCRRIQMVRPAGASFVVLSSGRSKAEPLGRCDQFFRAQALSYVWCWLEHPATFGCTVYDSPAAPAAGLQRDLLFRLQGSNARKRLPATAPAVDPAPH